jgi:murein DD-endopeptidase MepM/ murein hydrolase activator NlpD
MSTFTAHISRGAARRILVSLFAASLVATALGLAIQAAGAETKQAGYPWPAKPFDSPHPIRGSFGDPRTIFHVPPTEDGMMTGGGSFSFHFGVDIWAPNGTKVYPVVSGTVTEVSREWVAVDTGNGRVFQYWHIHIAVRPGHRVEAGKTVLGTIRSPFEHVHFSELQNGKAVNPLQNGHLSPYSDTTTPEVASISLRRADTGQNLTPAFLRGRVLMIAEAYDTLAMPVRGIWHGLPVAPALVTWRIQRWDGKVIVPEKVAADFRTTIPSNALFWSYYARGTYQNMSVFDTHYSWGQPGCFLFKLIRTPFDTKTVHDGVYDLVVTATDIRGNRSSKVLRLTIHNRPGWVGS